jgi:hypothetical protein
MSVEPAAVQSLYETTLRPRLAELERLRLTLRSYIVKAGVAVGVPVLLFHFEVISLLLPAGWWRPGPVVGFALILAGIGFAAMRYALPGLTAYLNYRTRFKQQVVSEIFRIVCPSAEYAPARGIAGEVFIGSGMFADRGSYTSDDRVRGRIGPTPFEAGEVKRQYSTGGKNSETRTVFHGLFFQFDFNKALSGVTFVDPEQAAAYQVGDRTKMSVVALESPEFEREYKVWSTNETEARYILTPAMMERLLALRRDIGRPVFAGFRGSRAFLGVFYGAALFEPSIAATTSLEAIQAMARHFAVAEQLVRELDLNTRIWTKGVDESLLRAPDAAPEPGSLEAVAEAGAGTLTPDQLWQAALKAVAGTTADDEAPAPRPARTRVQVEQRPDGATVSYGISAGFIVLVLVWVACLLVFLSALRVGAGLEYLGDVGQQLFPLLARLPTIGPLHDLVVAPPPGWEQMWPSPLWWLVGAGVLAAILSLWLPRVHRVVIGADAIRVYRGLRPFPLVYPRPPHDLIVTLERSVHLGRPGPARLANPFASPPTLSSEEARWVAAEMRAALKRTLRGRAVPAPP